MTVNCHYARPPNESPGVWDNCSDKFPLNTYKGNVEQVLDCLRNLFANPQTGINKVVILTDDEMEEANIGQAPMELGGAR